jgi:hypothetical protein
MQWMSVTLRCDHPTWDPDQISMALGMMPRISWRNGNARRTPKGDHLRGEYKSTYWYSEALEGFIDNPTTAFMKHLELLESKAAAIATILDSRGRLEFSIGWGLTGPCDGEFWDCLIMKKLGDLGIDLAISVYDESIDRRTPREA